ncbi:golgin subfamily A member 4 isoform X2 [Diabrotica virgifera virgifera]|uniref:Pericentrin-like n=1 Tax=Diabrotica virgifera virgifera TaxID=50390 RepID=A0ABM5KV04_DIAVI|nr:golgin subfamily A member 4 isoform X2 [Diabrotica virgifera virgifera]
MEGTSDKNPHEESPSHDDKSETDSVSLTVSLPLGEVKEEENSEDISEHISSNSGSIENDRSFQEIEVYNYQGTYLNEDLRDEVDLSEKQPDILNESLESESSIISLLYLERIEENNVSNLLEDSFQGDASKSDKDLSTVSKEESFNMFQNLDLDDKSLSNIRHSTQPSIEEKNLNASQVQNLDLDDKSLSNIRHITQLSIDEKNLNASHFGLEPVCNEEELSRKLKDYEELVNIQNNTITALTSELDSFREMSNPNTVSTLSTTEYKQLQEEWNGKILEYNGVILIKNDLIQKLTESLEQSSKEKEELMSKIGDFENEISELRETIKIAQMKNQTSDSVQEELNSSIHDKSLVSEDVSNNLEVEYMTLKENLDMHQHGLLKQLNLKFNEVLEEKISEIKSVHDQEIKTLKESVSLEKDEYESEISRLRALLAEFQAGSTQFMALKDELDLKHSREMEELRTYFEKKCADVEKNYSEEIYSQHSRKMSSSSCSEAELNSDLPFPHVPGPEGDVQTNLNKKDLINLQNELNSIFNKITKCDLDAMTDDDFSNLKREINRSHLSNLLKHSISTGTIKPQIEEHVNAGEKAPKMEDIEARYEEKFNQMKEKYEEELKNLRNLLELAEKQHLSISSTVQEVGSSEEFEINEVIQSYERRLQEQVILAKNDIVAGLEAQIQRLAASEPDSDEWPSELLRIRDRFTEKHEADKMVLNEEHRLELEKLKEEHRKILDEVSQRVLDGAKRRKLRDDESLNKDEMEILKERDILKQRVASMHNLFGELLKYFTQCEDELNNTLVEELLKQGFDKNMSQIDDELNLTRSSPSTSSKTSDSTLNITRVHLTPNFTDLINIIESSSPEEADSKDVSIDVKNELSVCLEKLKQEANAILCLTTKQPVGAILDSKNNNNLEGQITSLTRKLIDETQLKEDLKSELEENQKYIETLEKERERLETELENVIAKENILEEDLTAAKNKIGQLLESGRKEIVSEGYGEAGVHSQSLGDTMNALVDLQEKARNVLSQSRTSADPTLLHLIEELCRVGERIKEESYRERYDLQQQIEAADKKYRTTNKFLEEQAMEREQERDEAQKKIDALLIQLKERDKNKVHSEIVASEVVAFLLGSNNGIFPMMQQIEQLELQLQEKTTAFEASCHKLKDLEDELTEAVEKIKELREIIRNLEIQSETKSVKIQEYLDTINKLQNIIANEHGVGDGKDCDASKDVSDIGELYRHIEHLETELHKLRLNSELAGNEGATKQISTQLYEIEAQVDRKTKELEILHSTASTNCSSPSEDVSARDVVLPKSPKKMEDCEVPLQQLARLREKLIRHSRAEDAAMKRIRDLEMEVFGLKHELEETNGEREFMKKNIQEQLVLISDFQIRLDEQRIRADNIEKQTNTSLELKIYSLQKEVDSLGEKIQQKDRHINNQSNLLAETQQRVRNLENELSSAKEDDLVVDMQKEIDKLVSENAQMKKKIKNEAQMVPNLVGNIISDKNHDMERLRLKLEDTEKLLEGYTSLNIDKKDLQTLSNLKSNGTSLEELFSILDLSQPDLLRRMESRNLSESQSPLLFKREKSDDTLMEPELSSIMGPTSANSVVQMRNSTEISHKKVHFEDIDMECLKKELAELKNQLDAKDKIIKECNERLQELDNLQIKTENQQKSVEDTNNALTAISKSFEEAQMDWQNRERDLGIEIAEKKLKLEDIEKELDLLQQDSKRKDEMCVRLTKEIKDLEKEITKLKNENYLTVENVIKMKNEEMDNLEKELNEKFNVEIEKCKKTISSCCDERGSLLKEMELISTQLADSRSKNSQMEQTLKEHSHEIKKYRKEFENKLLVIESLTREMKEMKEKRAKNRRFTRELEQKLEDQKSSMESLEEEKAAQKCWLLEKETLIKNLQEEADRYKQEIGENMEKLEKEVKENESKIDELTKEKNHLTELLGEREKIIKQMVEDHQQVHLNLVSIKSKIQEPGHIIDLGNKLREEQKKRAELVQEIHNLKVQLMQCKSNEMTTSVDEIADQLKRELDNSIKIDSNIMSAVSDQSLSSISEVQDVEAYKKSLAKEKACKKQLLELVNTLQDRITTLQNDLEKERATLVCNSTEDAQCIEQLRIQLDAALDANEALKRAISERESENEQLEKDLESLKRKNISSASRSESTKYKELPSKESIALNKLQKDHDVLLGEQSKLIGELAGLRQTHLDMTTDYKCTKDLLALEMQRKKNLEGKVYSLQMRERELTENLTQITLEKERVVDEISQEKADLIKQKLELLQRLKSQHSFESSVTVTNDIPDELIKKISELNSAFIENKKLVDMITRISNEKAQVENELEIVRGAVKNSSVQLPSNDLAARADYLFAKTLKLESTKKALVFQKRYLMKYLLTQGVVDVLPDPVTQRAMFRRDFSPKHRFRAAVFVIISISRIKFLVKRWHSGVRIAERINSRHYKQTRRKNDATVVSAHFQVGQPVSNQFFLNAPPAGPTLRNPNQFVQFKEDARETRERLEADRESARSEEFYPERSAPWSGTTPPSKERRSRITIGNAVLNKEDMNPLKAPQLLAQFVERFDQIQEKLGVVLESDST